MRWFDLAWLWGFLIVLAAVLLCGSGSTARRGSSDIYEVDTFGGYTTELARPASRFFILLTVVLVGWASRSSSGISSGDRSSDGRRLAVRAPLRLLVERNIRYDPGGALAAGVRLAPGVEGSRPGVPGLQRFDVYAFVEDAGDVRLHCYTTWDTPEQLEAFVERGYTFSGC